MPSLGDLPAELYFNILSFFDPIAENFNQILLSLSRAIPRAPLPTYILFERIRLKHSGQLLHLYRRLRTAPEDAARVRTFSLECWTVDADVFVNLVALLPSIVELKIFIGPNFAPEHMEEILHDPKTNLRFISLRFRPYVQRPTYYQFLKGAYFDSTLNLLSKWPPQPLPTLSIVQDPLDPALAPTNFAQPLVFLRLDPLATLAVSPVCFNLKHFRLRVPSRQVCRYLHTIPHSFPSLEFLDMSTSNVSARDLEGLLGHLCDLQVLVLDRCPIVSQRTDTQLDAGAPFLQWMELGQAMALAGVKRALEREKQLKTWCEDYYAGTEEGIEKGVGTSKNPSGKRGRKGLATATISLRAPSPERRAGSGITIGKDRIPLPGQKVRVLPPPPVLCSLATSFPGDLTPETFDAVRTEFECGWASGIARLSSIRLRFLASYRNGVVRIVRYADKGTPEWEEEEVHGGQGLAGLVNVQAEDDFQLAIVGDEEGHGAARRGYQPPLLCLAGSGRDAVHVEGCGHKIGWSIFKDEI